MLCFQTCILNENCGGKEPRGGVFRHVASLCFKYFSCFRCMFQMFCMDVRKGDWDAVHVVMAIHDMFQVYVLNVSSVPNECCKCFIWMLQQYIWMLHIHACCKHMFQVFLGASYVCLQVFHLNDAYVCNDFQMFFKRFRKCLRLFQVFHLSSFVCCIWIFQKWIGVAHMGCSWKAAGGAGPLLVCSLASLAR
jgi:hypothetical protein